MLTATLKLLLLMAPVNYTRSHCCLDQCLSDCPYASCMRSKFFQKISVIILGDQNHISIFNMNSAEIQHRGITKLQNHLSWKRHIRSLSPSISPALPSPPLSYLHNCHVYTSLELFQRPWLHRVCGQPVTVVEMGLSKPIYEWLKNINSVFNQK